ncbi:MULTISPECIES: hypothetical protein [Aestuariimicrobium]|uniref:hypothetical protein n=1 Tax=Aestuariimicrobium TaxID=396388 RepID=UPI0003B3F949|nr:MULTISPECIES: hypothetical protein [Aestuariimicrobium]CAI9409345.1 hypothetical protein AESSP_02217 [Aestuariimicrobium sp. T2.26MG-19.2B]
MTLGHLMAIAGMVLYGVASVLQAAGARRASGPSVMAQPLYLVGLACDGLAWLASLVALAWLPLFVVQAVLAASLAVTVLLAVPVLRIRPSRGQLAAIAVVTLGLVVVSASAGDEAPASPPPAFTWALLGATVLLLAAAAVSYGRGHPALLGLVAGLLFSVSALGARAEHLGEHGVLDALRHGLTWLVVVAGVAGALMYARALERGAVGTVTAVLWVAEVVVPAAVGLLWLHDQVRAGWWAPALLGLAACIGGCIVLARAPANAEA